MVVHLPPNWVLSALFVLGTFLLMRWLWRQLLGTHVALLIRAADRAMRGGFVWTVLPAVPSVRLILLPLLGLQPKTLLVALVTVRWSFVGIAERGGPMGRVYLDRLRSCRLASP